MTIIDFNKEAVNHGGSYVSSTLVLGNGKEIPITIYQDDIFIHLDPSTNIKIVDGGLVIKP